jgi:thiol-disulfide isomerase/thioredoxin
MVDNARMCHRWGVEATTLTGLGVAASVLVASTGLGLWRRYRDGRMRPVGHMASPPAPKIAPTTATSGQPGGSASHENAASGSAASSRTADTASVAAGRAAAGRESDAASVAASRAAAGRDSDAAVGKAGGVAAGEPVPVDDGLLAGLGVEAGTPVTLLQFSSAFCAPCRATRRVCDEVAKMLDGVRHVEVDAEAHLDAVRALNIWRTPTVLVIDAAGRVVQRASGQPSKAHVIAAVAPLLDDVVVPS